MLRTQRLLLSPPARADAQAILQVFAGDEAVTRYVGWPRHAGISDTEAFLDFSEAQWRAGPAGPLLLRLQDSGELIGSTGLALESPTLASTGFVLARRHWGRGYASEALRAMIDMARSLGVQRLYALCHADHAASIRVLERCGLRFEGLLGHRVVFPNLGDPAPQEVRRYGADLAPPGPSAAGPT